MKFSCETYLLRQAVSVASRCAASKSPVPALEGLLIEAGQNIRITGYDLKKGVYTSFQADVAEPGAIILNARLFGNIINSLSDGIVTIQTDGTKASITCGAAEFSLMGTDSGEYPELPSVEKQNAVSIPQNALSKMIRQTIFAVSDNESRPIYTGSLFEIEEDTLTIVAVDGYRLAMRKETVDKNNLEECSFVVPAAALNDVEKLCSDTDDCVDITVGSKHISFSIGDTVLVSRRLEGEFLNYKKSVPTEFSINFTADRDDFMKAVSRVSLIIDEKTKNPLRMYVEKDNVTIRCKTAIGEGEDGCAVKTEGEASLVIGFNNRYLLDALKAAPGEEIKMGLNTASAPGVIYPADGSGSFAYMILPVRLRDE